MNRKFTSAATVLLSLLVVCASACSTWPLPGASLEGWHQIRSERLTLVGNVEMAALVRMAEGLSLFEAVLPKTTTVPAENFQVPTRIFVFDSQETFDHFSVESWAGGQMIPQPDGYLAGFGTGLHEYETRGVLYHEYAHVLLRGTHRFDLPGWYDEGVSEYLSTFRRQGDAVFLGASPAVRLSRLTRGGRISIEELLTPPSGITVEFIASYYATAWAFVHYMLSTPQLHAQLDAFIGDLLRGAPVADAFETHFERSSSLLGEAVDAHVSLLARGARFDIGFDTASLEVDRHWKARTLSAGEAAYQLAEFSRAADSNGDVSDRTKALFELAARHSPTRARAQAAYWWTRALNGRFAEAVLGVDAVLRDSPDDVEVLLFAGSIQELAAGSRERARSLYERAVAIDPSKPLAHAALGRSYLASDEPGSAELAVRELEAALRTGTWDPRLELDLGKSYVRAGSWTAARRTLERLQVLPHREGIVREAKQLIAQLPNDP